MKQVLFFLTMLAIAVLPVITQAAPDTLGVNTTVLSVRHMNSDAYADTLIGKQVLLKNTKRQHYQATQIRWGYDPGTSSQSISYFQYPNWTKLKTSTAVTRLNTDNSYDLIITMSGEELVSSVATPKAKMIALFGCDDLFAADTVNLISIDSLQTTPFTATKLRKGIELSESGYRDMSAVISYRIADINLSIDTNLAPAIMPLDVAEQTSIPPTFHIYPNPAVKQAIIEGHFIEPGNYRLRLVDNTGHTVRETDLHVSYFGQFSEKFTLEDLAAGRYLIQIINVKGIYSTHPLLILN